MATPSGVTETANFWRHEIQLQKRLDIAGEFWSDVVARLKREKQFTNAAIICRHAMPVPAAYRDLLICLRKLYRKGEDNRALLTELYAYAIESDVLHRVPYVEYETPLGNQGCPGFNVASIVWEWLKQKPILLSYDEIGYQHVQTLNLTDRKRLVNEFGEPHTHRDPFSMFEPLWDRDVEEMARH